MNQTDFHLTGRPPDDPEVLQRLIIIKNGLLFIAATVAIVIILSWWLQPFTGLFPTHFFSMQLTSAFCMLLLASSLAVLNYRSLSSRYLVSQLLSFVAVLVAFFVIYEHWQGAYSNYPKWLVSDSMRELANPVSLQTAICVVLLGVGILFDRVRSSLVRTLIDYLLLLLAIYVLIFISAHIYSADSLIQQSPGILFSVPTLVCVMVLGLAQGIRRDPIGFFSVIGQGGIGSHMSRRVLPLSLIVSLAIVLFVEVLLTTGRLQLPYAATIVAVTLTVILSTVTLYMANKINMLEAEIRRIAITDEMTGLYNRRGFYLFAEHALRAAKRSRQAVTIAFFDVNGLKQVNDNLGHDIGSELLCDVAKLIASNFRSNDVVGRFGGDEFVVISYGEESKMKLALQRMQEKVDDINMANKTDYTISYSVGLATMSVAGKETLDNLIERADKAMYEDKKRLKSVAI